MNAPVVVTALETPPTRAQIAELGALFDEYRVHYGETADVERSFAWLQRNISSGALKVFCAAVNKVMVGFATAVEQPASLRLRHYWQVRDLFVVPRWRGSGIARALVEHVRGTAEAAGALRLVVQTEADNVDALRLYEASGFVSIEGYRSLALPLAPDD